MWNAKNILFGMLSLSLITACGKSGGGKSLQLEDMASDMETAQDPGGNIKLSRGQKVSASARGVVSTWTGGDSSNVVIPPVIASYSGTSAAVPNYGYNTFMNQFLGYGDYFRYKNPKTTSITRLKFGAKAGAANYCGKWDFTIYAGRRVKIMRQPTAPGLLLSQPDENSLRVKWDSTQGGSAGVFFGVEDDNSGACTAQNQTAVYDPFAALIASLFGRSGTDPYASGYQGNFAGSYYYYPPPACAPTFAPTNVRVVGTLSECGTSGGLYQIEMDLTDAMSTAGYSPYKESLFGQASSMQVRTVNYDGYGWYGDSNKPVYSQTEIVIEGLLSQGAGTSVTYPTQLYLTPSYQANSRIFISTNSAAFQELITSYMGVPVRLKGYYEGALYRVTGVQKWNGSTWVGSF